MYLRNFLNNRPIQIYRITCNEFNFDSVKPHNILYTSLSIFSPEKKVTADTFGSTFCVTLKVEQLLNELVCPSDARQVAQAGMTMMQRKPPQIIKGPSPVRDVIAGNNTKIVVHIESFPPPQFVWYVHVLISIYTFSMCYTPKLSIDFVDFVIKYNRA